MIAARLRLARHALLCAFLLLPLTVLAQQQITVGVFAYRPKPEMQARWQPLIDYLAAALPDKQVKMRLLEHDELEQAIQRQELDFVLTNPSHFMLLRQRNGLSGALATLVEQEHGIEASAFGGVIFTRAGNRAPATLAALRGRTVAYPGQKSFAAYQIQAYELARAGIEVPRDMTPLITGWPQDRVVEAVLSGAAEVGFIRSGLIEQMTRDGQLDPSRLHIVNRLDLPGFPFLVSTRLYPEWPFVALPHVEEKLARQVAAALLSIDPDGPVARAGHFGGFTIPANYQPVEELLRELRLPPYDVTPPFSMSDVWARYWFGLLAAGAALLLIVVLMAWVVRINYRLQQERQRGVLQDTALRESEVQFRSLVENIPGAVYRCALDKHWTIHFMSSHIEQLTGYPLSDFIGNGVRTYASIIHPDDVQHVDEAVRAGVDRHVPYNIEYRIIHADGGVRWVFERGQAAYDAQGVVLWLDGAITDITERKQAEQDLHRFRFMVEHTPQEVWLAEMDGRLAYANRAACASLGYTPAELAGMTLGEVAPADGADFPELARQMKQAVPPPFESVHRAKDGRRIPKEIRATYLNIGSMEYICGFAQDVTERKATEERIRHLAYFDPLTSLPNRRMLTDRLGHALLSSDRTQEYGALLMLDLDHFKTLNDTQGHDAGDQLLVEVAQRLQCTVRQQDTVARLGGDEFVVMLEGLGSEERIAAGQAELVAEKVRQSLSEPFSMIGKERDFQTTSSIGVTLFHGQDAAGETLLKQADVALYQAKDAGRNAIRFFNPAMQAAIEARSAMESSLRRALQQNELQLFYQPQVDAFGAVIGAEALLRWFPPEQPPVSPTHFIPLAEETGLILPIGQWVLEKACLQLKVWEADERTRHLGLSINVSAKQFRQSEFIGQVAAAIEKTGARVTHLKLELTESALLEDIDNAITRMEQVRQLGVRFSLDDFGTGFSSLSYLKRLPLDQVKVDQSFVRDIADDPNDAAIVRAILAMSQSLGLSVIAEGVETDAQLDFLRQNGCTAFQGYLFGKPIPIAEWESVLPPATG